MVPQRFVEGGSCGLDPRYPRLAALYGSGAALVLCAALAALSWRFHSPLALAAGLLALPGLPALFWWHGRASLRRFECLRTAQEVVIRRGVWTHQEIHLPARRIQHIAIAADPLARKLDLATLTIVTASELHAVRVRGLNRAVAQELRAQLVSMGNDGAPR